MLHLCGNQTAVVWWETEEKAPCLEKAFIHKLLKPCKGQRKESAFNGYWRKCFLFWSEQSIFLTDNSQIKECNVQAVIYTPPGEEQPISTSKVRVQACLFLALSPSVVGNSFFILVLLIKSKHCYWLCSDEGLDWCCDVCQICYILFNIFILLSVRAKYLILKPQDFPNIWRMN